MIIIRFSTDGLVDFNACKDKKCVFVNLYYGDGSRHTLKEEIGTKIIEHYKETIMRKSGWVSFYEISEVFHISDYEKMQINKSRVAKKAIEEASSSNMQVKNGKNKSSEDNKLISKDIENKEDDWF